MLKVLDFNVPEDEKKGIYLIPDCWSKKNVTMQAHFYKQLLCSKINI